MPEQADHRSLAERVSRMEWRADETDRRLREGAESFEALREEIGDCRAELQEGHKHLERAIAPKPIGALRAIGVAFGIVVFAGGLVWGAARYPDRGEFSAARKEDAGRVEAVNAELGRVKERQQEIRTDQEVIKASLARQEKNQEAIQTKLDKLLEAGAGRR